MGPRLDWDDERIESAFRTRALRTAATPADLGEAVLERLERERTRSLRIGLLPAGAVVVLVVGLVGLVTTLGVRPSPRPPSVPRDLVPRHVAVFASQTELPWLDSGKVDRRRLTAILVERFGDG